MIYFQSQVDALLKAKDDMIVSLRSDILILRDELKSEKAKLEVSVDNILMAYRANPITVPKSKGIALTENLVSEAIEATMSAGQDFDGEPEKEAANG